jgi:hypothetical protein
LKIIFYKTYKNGNSENKLMKKLLCSAALVASMLCPSAESFAASQGEVKKDIQVAARTFGFIGGVPKGSLDVAIIYDETNAASQEEATILQGLMGGGMKAGKHKLTSTLVPASDAGSISANLAFVTTGLSGQYDSIFAATSGKSILSVSRDFACTAAQKCVMAITAKPKVKIEISRSAAAASGLKLASALKLMVTEKD